MRRHGGAATHATHARPRTTGAPPTVAGSRRSRWRRHPHGPNPTTPHATTPAAPPPPATAAATARARPHTRTTLPNPGTHVELRARSRPRVGGAGAATARPTHPLPSPLPPTILFPGEFFRSLESCFVDGASAPLQPCDGYWWARDQRVGGRRTEVRLARRTTPRHIPTAAPSLSSSSPPARARSCRPPAPWRRRARRRAAPRRLPAGAYRTSSPRKGRARVRFPERCRCISAAPPGRVVGGRDVGRRGAPILGARPLRLPSAPRARHRPPPRQCGLCLHAMAAGRARRRAPRVPTCPPTRLQAGAAPPPPLNRRPRDPRPPSSASR